MTPTTSPEARVRPISPPPDTVSEVEDPHDRLTPKQRARFAAYMAEPKELPKPGVDRKTGRALPISDEEWTKRMDRLKRELERIDAEDDDPPDTYERMVREINEDRVRSGRGPAFAEPETWPK